MEKMDYWIYHHMYKKQCSGRGMLMGQMVKPEELIKNYIPVSPF